MWWPMQETKVQDHEFPKEAIQAAGWNVIFHGQKSYNGVAFISKKPMTIIENRLYPKDPEEQARFLVSEYRRCKTDQYLRSLRDLTLSRKSTNTNLSTYADLKKYFEKNMFRPHSAGPLDGRPECGADGD
jgi:exonuclease III